MGHQCTQQGPDLVAWPAGDEGGEITFIDLRSLDKGHVVTDRNRESPQTGNAARSVAT
jgi:hypothetical protein